MLYRYIAWPCRVVDVTVIDLREKFGIAGDRSAGNSGKWGKKYVSVRLSADIKIVST